MKTLFLIFVVFSFFLLNESDAQALSPWGKVGLAALGGAVVDRTFFRQPTSSNNYYYSYPGYGYYTYGKRK